VLTKSLAQIFFDFPKSSFGEHKIVEGGTKDEMLIFEARFHGSWPKFTTRALVSASKIRISSFVPPSTIFV
jgi:hypothetical protein